MSINLLTQHEIPVARSLRVDGQENLLCKQILQGGQSASGEIRGGEETSADEIPRDDL